MMMKFCISYYLIPNDIEADNLLSLTGYFPMYGDGSGTGSVVVAVREFVIDGKYELLLFVEYFRQDNDGFSAVYLRRYVGNGYLFDVLFGMVVIVLVEIGDFTVQVVDEYGAGLVAVHEGVCVDSIDNVAIGGVFLLADIAQPFLRLGCLLGVAQGKEAVKFVLSGCQLVDPCGEVKRDYCRLIRGLQVGNQYLDGGKRKKVVFVFVHCFFYVVYIVCVASVDAAPSARTAIWRLPFT